MDGPPPDYRRMSRIVAGGLFAGSAIFLAVAWFFRHSVRSAGGLPALAYVATAFAVAAPVIGWMMRSLPPPAGEATSAANAQAMYAREISSIAVMEGAALFCAIAVLVGPYDWPVIPAAILLALILSRAVGA